MSNNPVNYVDPTGIYDWEDYDTGLPKTGGSSGSSGGGGVVPGAPDNILWTALYTEITIMVGATIFAGQSPMFGRGIASVRFQNGKGDAFMADYEFRFSPKEPLASALTASFTVSVGILQADFPTGYSYEDIADSYKGIFHNRGVSAWKGSAQYVSSDKGLWRGGELGLSLGKGATIGRIGFRYEQVGRIRPVVQ